MRVIGIDQGDYLGWAAGSKSEGALACGLIDTSARRFDSIGARFLRMERALRELFAKYTPGLVVIEEHRAHKGVQAAQMLAGRTGIILKLCAEMNIEHMGVPVATAKVFGTGTGRASKELMVAAARKKYPHLEIATDDVADALHFMAWGIHQVS